MKMMRRIKDIQKDLKDAKRELRRFWAAVGDDLGCDGTDGQLEYLRGWVQEYREELVLVREERAAKKAAALMKHLTHEYHACR